VLLIARAVDDPTLTALVSLALAVGVEPLVEVRDEAELDAALAAGARVIGVNNRDLETLVIDRGTGARLIPRIPPDCVAIAESGVRDAADVAAAAAAGADAVLVGSSVSAAPDAAAAVRALASTPRRGRAVAV
jgi:indole-3-glycerol phosphate synthase